MGTEQHEPLLPSPKVIVLAGLPTLGQPRPVFCRCQLGSQEGWGLQSVPPHPTPKCGAQALLGRGSKQLPGSCVCSVTRPELPGPLSCWPGSCLLLTPWPPLAPGSKLPALGRPRTPSPVFSLQRSCPRWSHGLGCWGGCSGREGGSNIYVVLCFRQQEFPMPGRVSALLEGDVGNPLVVSPTFFAVTGHLHQAVAFPGVCMRVLWEGEKRGSAGAPRSGWGVSLSQGSHGENRLAQNNSLGEEAWRPAGCPRDMPSVAER